MALGVSVTFTFDVTALPYITEMTQALFRLNAISVLTTLRTNWSAFRINLFIAFVTLALETGIGINANLRHFIAIVVVVEALVFSWTCHKMP